MEDKPRIDKLIFLRISRWAEEEISFRFLIRQSNSGCAVGETTNDDLESDISTFSGFSN